MAKIDHNAKAIAFAKSPVWAKIQNSQKHAKKHSTIVFKLFCAKNGSQKNLIFEKWQLFHHGQNWPQCKGYSLCKIGTLGQNLKFSKTC